MSKKYWKPRPGFGFDGNEVYEEQGSYGDSLWLVPREGGSPLTFRRSNMEPYTPPPPEVKVGDVWLSVMQAEYRCIGVDEKNKQAFWVQADEFHDGDYPVVKRGEVQANDAGPKVDIFTRELPEEYLVFDRRAD